MHKIYRNIAPRLPVAAYDDLSAFKIYLVDVGLLRRLAQLSPTAFGEGNRLFTEFKSALTENYVLQTIIIQFEVLPRYWSQTTPPYEVDFLIQRENDVFPVEVKSEVNTASRSLRKLKELFPEEVKLRIRFSLDNLELDGDVLNYPSLYSESDGETDWCGIYEKLIHPTTLRSFLNSFVYKIWPRLLGLLPLFLRSMEYLIFCCHVMPQIHIRKIP